MPRSTHSSPSRRAVVDSWCVFEPASGSVIANTTLRWPAAMPGSQAFFCALAAVAGEDLAGDRARDQQQEQRGALGGGLLAHQRQLGEAGAAAAELLGDVDPDESLAAERLPQLGGGLVPLGVLGVVRAAVRGRDPGHRLTDGRVVRVLVKLHSPGLHS